MTDNRLDLLTIDHAWTYYRNSGLVDWQWFDGHDEAAFVRHLWQCGNGHRTVDEIVAEYLIDHGEEPSDYGITLIPCEICDAAGLVTAATHETGDFQLCEDCYEEFQSQMIFEE